MIAKSFSRYLKFPNHIVLRYKYVKEEIIMPEERLPKVVYEQLTEFRYGLVARCVNAPIQPK